MNAPKKIQIKLEKSKVVESGDKIYQFEDKLAIINKEGIKIHNQEDLVEESAKKF